MNLSRVLLCLNSLPLYLCRGGGGYSVEDHATGGDKKLFTKIQCILQTVKDSLLEGNKSW